jgi:hypothetical protein
MMQWDRSDVIGLAQGCCRCCQGTGIRLAERWNRESPCNCVFRAIFRACYNRFRECNAASRIGTVALDFTRGPEGRQTFSRKREEFMADFCLVSRRVLDDEEYRIFRYHFLLGADWRLCTRHFNLDRGEFFHETYRIQQKLGRAFAELEPYPLYPVYEYFSHMIGQERALKPQKVKKPKRQPFILPLSA